MCTYRSAIALGNVPTFFQGPTIMRVFSSFDTGENKVPAGASAQARAAEEAAGSARRSGGQDSRNGE